MQIAKFIIGGMSILWGVMVMWSSSDQSITGLRFDSLFQTGSIWIVGGFIIMFC